MSEGLIGVFCIIGIFLLVGLVVFLIELISQVYKNEKDIAGLLAYLNVKSNGTINKIQPIKEKKE